MTRFDLSRFSEEVLTEEQLVSAAAAALQNLRPTSLQRTFESLRKWRTADARNAKRLPAEVLHDLEQTLPSLIGACPALLRYRKAARLANITGSTAQSIALICDARPVFNASRDVIEGMITLTTLTIAYEGEDEVTRSFEVHLTPEMLETLVEKAQQAQRKLSVLSESIGNWIPNGLAVFPE